MADSSSSPSPPPSKSLDNIFARLVDGVRSGLHMYNKRYNPINFAEISDEKRDEFKATSVFSVKGVLPCEDVGMFADYIEDSLRDCGAKATISFPSSQANGQSDAIVTAYIPREELSMRHIGDAASIRDILQREQYAKRGFCRRLCCCCCCCCCDSIYCRIFVAALGAFMAIGSAVIYIGYKNNAFGPMIH